MQADIVLDILNVTVMISILSITLFSVPDPNNDVDYFLFQTDTIFILKTKTDLCA